jgi:hypothetical protein
MPTQFAKFSILSTALAVLLIGAPAFAQSQSAAGNDPFSGVTAVDSDQMSDVNGELAGGLNTGVAAYSGTGSSCTGAQCGGGVSGNAVGTTSRDVSASGNSVSVNVTAISIQNSIVGPSSINTSGGSNYATGGSAN